MQGSAVWMTETSHLEGDRLCHCFPRACPTLQCFSTHSSIAGRYCSDTSVLWQSSTLTLPSPPWTAGICCSCGRDPISVPEMHLLWVAFIAPPQAYTDPETHPASIKTVWCTGYSCPTFACCDLREFQWPVCLSKVFVIKV